MALDNYADFQAAIADQLARNDLSAQVVDCITLFEAEASRELFRMRGNEKTTILIPSNPGTLTISSITNNGSGLARVVVTSSLQSTTVTGTEIRISGTSTYDGTWIITLINSTTFDLQGSTFVGNSLANSSKFESSPWTLADATITTSATTAPDGSNTAEKLVEDSTTNGHNVQQLITKASSALTYTFSIYVKAAQRNLDIALSNNAVSSFVEVTFFPSTGTTSAPNVVGGFSLLSFGFATDSLATGLSGNGWLRAYLTFTTDSTTILRPIIALYNGSTVYAGDNSSGVYIWGAALTQTSSLQPYTATGTAIEPQGVAPLPSDYMGWRRVTWTGNPQSEMEYVSPQVVAVGYPNSSPFAPLATPRVFTIQGSNLLIMPIDGTPIEFDYFAKTAALSSSLNWLFTNHVDAYWNGVLEQAYSYEKDYDQAGVYQTKKANIFQQIKTQRFREDGKLYIRVGGTQSGVVQ